MTKSLEIDISAEDVPAETQPSPPEKGRAKRIRLFSRIGFYALVVGLSPVLADIVVNTWGWGIKSVITPLGLLVAGAGTLAASVMIVKELRGSWKPVKLAALVGVPFGAILLILGTMYLAVPANAISVALFSAGVKAALFLGISLVVLLIAGFFTNRGDAPEVAEESR